MYSISHLRYNKIIQKRDVFNLLKFHTQRKSEYYLLFLDVRKYFIISVQVFSCYGGGTMIKFQEIIPKLFDILTLCTLFWKLLYKSDYLVASLRANAYNYLRRACYKPSLILTSSLNDIRSFLYFI